MTSATAILASTASAVTFDVVFAGTDTSFGSVAAPAGGGPATSGSLLIDGGTYDVLGAGAQAPVVDIAEGDFNDGAAFFNSASFPASTTGGDVVCGPGDCLIEFFDVFDPEVPGEYVALFVPDGMSDMAEVIDTGFYEITGGLLGPTDEAGRPPPVIPLPAGLPLLVGGLGALALARRRHP